MDSIPVVACAAFSAAEAWSHYDAVELWSNKGYLPHIMRSMEAGPALARFARSGRVVAASSA